MFKVYLVGGAVRDKFLGVQSKDLDFIVMAQSFDEMKGFLLAQGCKIFVEKPEYLTIRANHPVWGAVDFACPRTDGNYTDGRRPDSTSIADTLEADLERRDFTCNAIAQDMETGDIIDPFNGRADIESRKLRCVNSARARFHEDKLRAFRALRFAITKGFHLDVEISNAIGSLTVASFQNVASERIREELLKMFKVNWLRSTRLLTEFPHGVLLEVINERGIWFVPTLSRI